MCQNEKDKKVAIKAARRELFALTDCEINPDWDKDPAKFKRRDELLMIIDRLRNKPVAENGWQRYFDKRPGLEDRVVGMLKSGATNSEIYSAVGVTIHRQVAYLRRKYQIPNMNKGGRKKSN